MLSLAPLYLREKGRDWSLKEANEMHVKKGLLWGLNHSRSSVTSCLRRVQ